MLLYAFLLCILSASASFIDDGLFYLNLEPNISTSRVQFTLLSFDTPPNIIDTLLKNDMVSTLVKKNRIDELDSSFRRIIDTVRGMETYSVSEGIKIVEATELEMKLAKYLETHFNTFLISGRKIHLLMQKQSINRASMSSAFRTYKWNGQRLLKAYAAILTVCSSSKIPLTLLTIDEEKEFIQRMAQKNGIYFPDNGSMPKWKCALESDAGHIVVYSDIIQKAYFSDRDKIIASLSGCSIFVSFTLLLVCYKCCCTKRTIKPGKKEAETEVEEELFLMSNSEPKSSQNAN